MSNELTARQTAQSSQVNKKLTLVQGQVLDMVAEGKTVRQIAETLFISPAEASKMAYDLLDGEIVTDTEQRRKLQVYRLEKLVEALWQRTMNNANKDDVKNLREVLADLNTLLGLNKEQDLEQMTRMHSHQLAAYMNALKGLMAAFMLLNPNIMTPQEWANWTAEQLEIAQNTMTLEIEQ